MINNAVYFLKMVLTDANATTKEYLGIIKQEIDISQGIITDLLDFARTRTPQIGATKIDELISESLKKCDVPESVELRMKISDNLPTLKVDSLQMQQVLQNLITNGIQAMSLSGVIIITAHPVGGFVAIGVEDTGEGISPEGMKRLFQPLFTTKPKGIGLGLVVCKNLVKANGGTIEVASELGKGTTFTVILPIAKEGET